MRDERETLARQFALERRSGMSPEGREVLAKHNEGQEWWGRCRHCGDRVRGTLAALGGHRCGS